jgi:nucleotide-binding universal stress UspA family protein
VEATVDEAAAAVRFSGVPVQTHAIREAPADALLQVADKVDAKLIVVGNRGMHGAKRFVLGSVPNTVSHKARCNVLIVSTEAR